MYHTGSAGKPLSSHDVAQSVAQEHLRDAHPLQAAATHFVATLVAERDRWVLWAPVAIGCGILLYFALSFEPPWWVGPGAIAAFSLVAAIARRRPVALATAAGCVLVGIGFAAAQLRTAAVDTPTVERRVGPTAVEGRIVRVDPLDGGSRWILSDLTIRGLPPAATPTRIRIRLNGEREVPPAGAIVRFRAILNPLPPPVSPGAFDFQRHAFFDRVGATGFPVGRVTVIDGEPPRSLDRIGSSMAGFRDWITAQLNSILPRNEASIAVALLTGQQSGIPKDVMNQMRDSGLAHLLSISGLHIGLVAGIIFLGTYFALRFGNAHAGISDKEMGCRRRLLRSGGIYGSCSSSGPDAQVAADDGRSAVRNTRRPQSDQHAPRRVRRDSGAGLAARGDRGGQFSVVVCRGRRADRNL